MSDLTLGGAAALFAKMAATMAIADREAIEHAANVVLKEVKSEPGEYQKGAGPFADWGPLADATLKDKAAKGLPSPSPELRTGTLRDSYERTIVSNHEAQVGSNSDVAVAQELGTSKMPPRSIVGIAGARKEHEIHRDTGRIVHGFLVGGGVLGKITK